MEGSAPSPSTTSPVLVQRNTQGRTAKHGFGVSAIHAPTAACAWTFLTDMNVRNVFKQVIHLFVGLKQLLVFWPGQVFYSSSPVSTKCCCLSADWHKVEGACWLPFTGPLPISGSKLKFYSLFLNHCLVLSLPTCQSHPLFMLIPFDDFQHFCLFFPFKAQ